MKKISIVYSEDVKVDELYDKLKSYGFAISNPDQKKGEVIDIIIRENQRIVGFDMFPVEHTRKFFTHPYNINKIIKWLENEKTN